MATALHRKANKKDIDEEFKKLIRNNEFDQIIQLLENKASISEIDRLEGMMGDQIKQEVIDQIKTEIETKANKDEIEFAIEQQAESIKDNSDKTVNTIQSQLATLADNVNEQFELQREDIYEKLSNKLDAAALMEVTTKLAKKADNERVNSLIAQHKNNLIDILENYKKELRSK